MLLASIEDRRNSPTSLSFSRKDGMCLNCSEYCDAVGEESIAVEKKCSSSVMNEVDISRCADGGQDFDVRGKRRKE